MKKLFVLIFASAFALLAQSADGTGALDHATIASRHAGQDGPSMFFSGTPFEITNHGPVGHPYHIEARHSDGTLFYTYDGYNMRVTQGTTWQSQLMADTSTPTHNVQANYLALTNTAITPAEADTSLSGEITANGLGRAQGTYTNSGTTLTVPSAPTVTPTGTAGSTTYFYWVAACNQGICTTPSASGTTSTSNATLTSGNYNTVTWTPISGAVAYQLYRTTANTAPSGTVSDLVGNTAACTSATCTQLDASNTLTSVTIPASNLTNFGLFTLVHTWTATATQAAQAFGVFYDATASDSAMVFEGTFSQVTLNSGDTLQLTESVYF